ncbi:MAG TPA: transcriptional regulator [Clostridiales bacterium]|nr:MAG: hypothetical protein A2Y22_08575 [Clostridiales bacterium GWD2_32_59]HAN09383.1 transcriptional regulator [Clostridiales bacterium]
MEQIVEALKFHNKYLYTILEVAEILMTNTNRIYDLINEGLLIGIKVGNLKVRKKDLESFLETYAGMDITDICDIKPIHRNCDE